MILQCLFLILFMLPLASFAVLVVWWGVLVVAKAIWGEMHG